MEWVRKRISSSWSSFMEKALLRDFSLLTGASHAWLVETLWKHHCHCWQIRSSLPRSEACQATNLGRDDRICHQQWPTTLVCRATAHKTYYLTDQMVVDKHNCLDGFHLSNAIWPSGQCISCETKNNVHNMYVIFQCTGHSPTDTGNRSELVILW